MSTLLPHYTLNDALSRYTTFRIGGTAEIVYHARTAEAVQIAAEHADREGLAWRVIGEGSNILASDAPFEGAIIAFKNAQLPTLAPSGEIIVSGGTNLGKLVYFCIGCGFRRIEMLAGIPGTVGGAITGNAGAYGQTISTGLTKVKLMARDGTISTVPADELDFAYRHSRLKYTGEVVLEAYFTLPMGNSDELKDAAGAARTARNEKHPNYFQTPTAGSFFKNLPPPPGETKRLAAGKLLDQVGARQMQVGFAALWHKHANIVINLGSATARDVIELTDQMAARVKDSFGVELEPEVTFL